MSPVRVMPRILTTRRAMRKVNLIILIVVNKLRFIQILHKNIFLSNFVNKNFEKYVKNCIQDLKLNV